MRWFGMRTAVAGLACVAAVAALPAGAQKYPDRPIELIVPWPAGGGIDLPGRLIAQAASKQWNVPINVVNKPGASGALGTLEALRARPTGHTLLVDSGATSSIQSIVVKDLPYKVEARSFVASALTLPMNHIVKADSPWKSLADVERAAKADPAAFVWATAAPSTVLNLVMDQFVHSTGVPVRETKRVVFEGGPAVAQAVAGGHAVFGAFAMNSTLPLIQAGKLRSLGVLMPQRVPQLPDVPTAAEQGYPQLNATAWIGISGPERLAPEVVTAWNDVLQRLARDPQFAQDAEKIGTVPFYLSAADFRAFVIEETRRAAEYQKQ